MIFKRNVKKQVKKNALEIDDVPSTLIFDLKDKIKEEKR